MFPGDKALDIVCLGENVLAVVYLEERALADVYLGLNGSKPIEL